MVRGRTTGVLFTLIFMECAAWIKELKNYKARVTCKSGEGIPVGTWDVRSDYHLPGL